MKDPYEKKSKYDIGTFENQIWDVLADEKDRQGSKFDREFYEEQKTSWQCQIKESVHLDSGSEDPERVNKEKRKKSQYADFRIAETVDVDKAIHQGQIEANKRNKTNFLFSLMRLIVTYVMTVRPIK